MASAEKKLILKRGIARRVERGHLWIFSNEVETIQGDVQAGDEVDVYSAKNKFLGMALYNKSSLIWGRIYSRIKNQSFDKNLIQDRIKSAYNFRKELGMLSHSYRLLHSEADGIPGVIVDVFGDYAVVQILTYPMEIRRDIIFSELNDFLKPKALIERSDVPFRELEGFPQRKKVVFGSPLMPCEIIENKITLFADLLSGQKTGYYLDQRQNRNLAAPFFCNKKVLDLFCYVGSWTMTALANGASEVTAIDSSESAIELAKMAYTENGFTKKATFLKSDVFSYLKETSETDEKFDLIILDPPPLAKSKRDVENALKAYRELNYRAMKVLNENGLLITCSCSHNVSVQDFIEILTLAAKDSSSDFSIINQPIQPSDHPIHLQTPETNYLKTFFLKKRRF